MSIIRTRWAAIGAAVAVTLGAGGIGIVSATQPRDAVAFVPITPCRVMDTRTDSNVGAKDTPVGPGEVYTVNTTTGDTGNCTDIPATATGVSLNITALDATLPTFLTVWATGDPQPEASSLNPVPGQPPTPNAVTTGVDTNGQFDIYNLQGNVQVIADINGYYTDHHHDDRYYSRHQTDAALAGKADAANTYTKSQSDEAFGPRTYELSIPAPAFQARSGTSTLQIGSGGQLIVASGTDDIVYAPVMLPDGAVITGLRVWAWDSSLSSSLEVGLRLVGNTSATYSIVGPLIATTGFETNTREYAVDIADYVVDVDEGSLVVQAWVPDGDWTSIAFGIRLQHVIVEYEL